MAGKKTDRNLSIGESNYSVYGVLLAVLLNRCV